jgi:Mlc titration factor MtfA (ptsG expression regulator)
MFGLLRGWRRRGYRKRPFPDEWLEHLDTHVPFFAEMEGDDRQRFLDNLKIFVWEKHFIEAGGMVITDEVKVVIAAAAARLIHHLDLDFYNRLTEIVVYPTHYHHKDGDDDTVVYGEAHHWGTVVLSWEAVLNGLRNPHDGHDTATHEFAHVLDRTDGSFDGTPELRASEHYRAWASVMTDNYTKLRKRKKKQRRALRQYGATNEAEFFAVATETFFEKPDQLKKQTPELYDELKRFYGFDPAED